MPFMETGATDGLFLRNAGIPVYGVTGIAYDPEDVRAHGKDERILVRSFDEGLEFAYQIAKALAGPSRIIERTRDPRLRRALTPTGDATFRLFDHDKIVLQYRP